MLEMECTNLTPSSVLETSGHVDRFTDFMVKDEVTGECFRADKLLEDGIDQFLASNPNLTLEEIEEHKKIQRQADAFTAEELDAMLKKYNINSPSHPHHKLTFPYPFNLMFKTTIGPEGTAVGFLRPETAQGLFVNFKRLLEYNQQKVPFAAAQIGLGFRNEIAPRNGLLRVREFCMAEIEHFVHPNNKDHPKFASIADKKLVLFSSDAQLTTGRTQLISIGEAVKSGLVNNETLGYFMTRTQLWCEKIGIDPKRMRFRQHLKTEMAHYATDCWDLEIHMSYGWIECVGHADRSCYDLEQHGKRTKTPLVASQRLDEPIQVTKLVCEPNKKLLGPLFKLRQKEVLEILTNLNDDEVQELETNLKTYNVATLKFTSSDETFEITPNLVTFQTVKKTVHEEKFTPSVIEPSYGIGRILYALLEHSFTQRSNDEQRCVMNFAPAVSPIKVGLFRLVNNNKMLDILVDKIHGILHKKNIVTRIDSSSGTIGRRYARSDELGVLLGVTIDFQSIIDETVTLRERKSMSQVRLPISSLVNVVEKFISEEWTWEDITKRFQVVNNGNDEDDEESKEKKSDVDTTSPLIIQRTTRGTFSIPNPNYIPKK